MNEQQLAELKRIKAILSAVTGLEDDDQEYIEDARKALQSIISQDALDKMAENARELGLSYDDEPKIGCVNHDCDKCKAVQEPVGEVYRHGKSSNGTPWHGVHWFDEGVDMPHGTPLYTTPPAPQPVPVKTYHDGKPWPVAPKPWVGLTDEELYAVRALMSPEEIARAIETILKEKNT